MTNVVQLIQPSLDQLGERCDAAIDMTVSSRADWVNASLEIASCFAEARARFNKSLFSEWLDKGKRREISRQDRLALIGFGGDLAIARDVLEKTTRNSYRLIWDENKKLFPAGDDVPSAGHISPVRKNPKPPRASKPKKLSNKQPRPFNERNPLFKLPRGREINEHLLNAKNGAWGIGRLLAMPDSDDVWDMIVQCYDAGFMRNSDYYWNAGHDICSLRLLFPEALEGFACKHRVDLASSRKHIRDIIIPAALESRDELLADPGKLESIVKKYWRAKSGDDNDDEVDASLWEKPKQKKAQPQQPKPQPQPRREMHSMTTETYKPLTREEVDPEFTGTNWEWIDKYGHVQGMTAEQYATQRLSGWASNVRALAKRWKELPELGRAVDHNWLRSPKRYDVEKLTEALEFLRPLIAEAEALLVTATAALKKDAG